MRSVHLVGDPPEVKILGEIIPDELETASTSAALLSPTSSARKPLAPPPRPPLKGIVWLLSDYIGAFNSSFRSIVNLLNWFVSQIVNI